MLKKKKKPSVSASNPGPALSWGRSALRCASSRSLAPGRSPRPRRPRWRRRSALGARSRPGRDPCLLSKTDTGRAPLSSALLLHFLLQSNIHRFHCKDFLFYKYILKADVRARTHTLTLSPEARATPQGPGLKSSPGRGSA